MTLFDYMLNGLFKKNEGWHSALFVPQTEVMLETAWINLPAKKVEFNKCYVRIWDDGTVEWIEKKHGRTTITHGSFAHPHAWRIPPGKVMPLPPLHERTDYEGCVDASRINQRNIPDRYRMTTLAGVSMSAFDSRESVALIVRQIDY